MTEKRQLIPLAGLIDLGAEQARLAKEIVRIEGEIRKCEGKLGNANFVANAPAEVVTQERQRIVDWGTQLEALRARGHGVRFNDGRQGDAHSIWFDAKTGTAYGAHDRRTADSKASAPR